MLQLSKVKVANLVKLLILIENVEMYDLRTEKYLQINLRCNIACKSHHGIERRNGIWLVISNLSMHTELVILRQMEDDLN